MFLLRNGNNLRLALSQAGKFRYSQYIETEFEKKWRKLPEVEREAIGLKLAELEKTDWRTLTKDQMRNSIISNPNV